MTSAALDLEGGERGFRLPGRRSLLWCLLAVIAAGITAPLLETATGLAMTWPADLVIPLKQWMTAFFHWLGTEAGIGPLRVRDITRAIAALIAIPLDLTEGVLYRGIPEWRIEPLPWVALVAAVAILGHWIAGVRLALFCTAATAYLAIFGLWSDAMRTLSIVLVSVPVAAVTGLLLGIWSTRSRRAEAVLAAVFDVMQATPHMAYLAPVVVLFGFGQVPAMMATVIFAMPPMARCVILGIRTVPSDVIEAGRMSGCTPRQLLWKVELPAAHQTLMLGLNQVVMQTLAMAVIASLVGASGLGQKLLFSLQQLYIGKATEQGIAIVLIAVVLDRLTQAYAYRPPQYVDDAGPLWQRHRHLAAFLAVVAVSIVLARFMPVLLKLPEGTTVSFGSLLDGGVRWFSKNAYPFIQPVRDWITVELLLPLRDFYLVLPWPVVLGAVGYAGFRLGGPRMAALVASLAAAIGLTGFWVPAMMTLYLVTAAAILCVAIGVPMGVWCARSDRAARVVMGVCDTLQTFPSFIYLIPVIMLLKVGDVSNIVAILAYASVPAIRFTNLGIRRIPAVTIEAARAAGCTSLQRLVKVELPIALPEIMLGINQTIMMALAMTAITALIGSRDLGQEIYKALPGADTGRGVLAGLGIAFIGIIADRLIGAWAARRKTELGITA
jgi:glycine betaine/proline transport system permease protein